MYRFSETEINDGEIKRKKLVTHGCQTDPELLALAKITEEDLTTEGEPSEGYWKVLAEKRRVALDLSLRENEELYEEVNGLQQQLELTNQMLDESKNLVEILTEMLEENEGDELNKSECPNALINASIAEEASEDMVTPVKQTIYNEANPNDDETTQESHLAASEAVAHCAD